ncbi:hypothetical protein GWO43_29190, partial [candidate division KSB1 bacterium]|nr:hypothetical protein [candidate division KSB1 bacterium]NIR72867.1 hypothetical protein [candidate division KSB1 bacterium]NIS27985.1 hypothetical protein [candidate division KSB1 bacterium]NIT74863.1 hypothetical protein [candidate division KSB1 bacterium]NIU28641.1 hypothetical protein [candidate division KSB1 bacterium]
MRTCVSLLFLFVLGNGLNAQVGAPEVVTTETFLSVDKVRPEDQFKIAIKGKIDDKWHVNSNNPSEEFLIPTVVKFDSMPNIEVSRIEYPEGEMRRFEFSENPLSVYEGEVIVR